MDITTKGLKFLRKIEKQNGVCIGGAYDDARVAKPLHRAGLIEIGNLPSGTAEWRLTAAGVAAVATLAERLQEAENNAGRHLGNANEEEARGATKTAAKSLAKSAWWLDRANALRGDGEGR